MTKEQKSEMDKLREEKVVATLSKKEMQLLENYNACQTACEKIVRKIVREHELAEIQMQQFWKAVYKKYKLKEGPEIQHIIKGDKVIQYNSLYKDLNEMVTKYQTGKIIKENVYEAFGLTE